MSELRSICGARRSGARRALNGRNVAPPERLDGAGRDMAGIEAGCLVHGERRILVLENVRQGHDADLYAGVERPGIGQVFEHETAEAAFGAFLDRDKDFVVLRQPLNQVPVQRP